MLPKTAKDTKDSQSRLDFFLMWVQELLNGHPKHIQCELGVTKDDFRQLIHELQTMGHTRSRYVSLEEQPAIFLYTSVTSLTV